MGQLLVVKNLESQNRSVLIDILKLFFFLILFFYSCRPIIKEKTIDMNWSKFDLDLPNGIEVLQGVNKKIPLRAWAAIIDLENINITAKILSSSDVDGVETPSSFLENNNAIIVLNGGYYISDNSRAKHVGLLKTSGVLREPASPSIIKEDLRYYISRGAFGIRDNGTPDIAWASTYNDSIFEWDRPIANRPGYPSKGFSGNSKRYWKVSGALHAGPILISNGNIDITVEEEVFFNTPVAGVQPRSAVGYTENNKLILMVVDGRQPESRGVYLEELAVMLKYFNCYEAINLDGGGSSAIVADTRLLNRPSGLSSQREIMSAIGIFYKKV